jgi:GNAT superfamily N-acetyltransferase
VDIGIATSKDSEAIERLLRGQFDEHGIALDPDALRHAVRGALEQPSRGTFLLARSPAPIGLAYLAYTWTLEHGGPSAWLDELYVLPAERDRGVGTALLHAALEHAAREGCGAIDLEVETTHARAARLYAREGFRPHTRARWYRRLERR